MTEKDEEKAKEIAERLRAKIKEFEEIHTEAFRMGLQVSLNAQDQRIVYRSGVVISVSVVHTDHF